MEVKWHSPLRLTFVSRVFYASGGISPSTETFTKSKHQEQTKQIHSNLPWVCSFSFYYAVSWERQGSPFLYNLTFWLELTGPSLGCIVAPVVSVSHSLRLTLLYHTKVKAPVTEQGRRLENTSRRERKEENRYRNIWCSSYITWSTYMGFEAQDKDIYLSFLPTPVPRRILQKLWRKTVFNQVLPVVLAAQKVDLQSWKGNKDLFASMRRTLPASDPTLPCPCPSSCPAIALCLLPSLVLCLASSPWLVPAELRVGTESDKNS